jgi:Cys-tRNA(Pro)/Cys-tRNA(Cys) deacylase
MKTNATRILDSLGIRYELRDYEVDPEHLDAETVAGKVGMPAEQVFKTLVVCGQGRECYFAVVPGNAELDLKALAKLAGERRIELAPLKDVQTMTGYIRGGVTVMGAKKDFPVYLDETAWLYDTISVSAGVRGSQILLAPEDYIGVTQATVAPIAKEKEA